jgi:hypothetical protein
MTPEHFDRWWGSSSAHWLGNRSGFPQGGHMNVVSIITAALDVAHKTPDIGETPGKIHRNRSKVFVEALAGEFRAEYASRADVVVLSKHYAAHRHQLGLNELLFDVTVCGTGVTPSAVAGRNLTHLTGSLWAVESEFARDSRKAVFDFNKLVLSAADQKLFVGPTVDDEESFLAVLGPVADCCTGSVFVALIPHPEEWGAAGHLACRVWTRAGNKWAAVS